MEQRITQKQVERLTRFGYTWEEVRGWSAGYAGKVLRERFQAANKYRTKKRGLKNDV